MLHMLTETGKMCKIWPKTEEYNNLPMSSMPYFLDKEDSEPCENSDLRTFALTIPSS